MIRYTMASKKKNPNINEEKEWENPVAPAMTSDDRDKEQLLRQFKEAKRRKDNLSADEENKTDKRNT